MKYRIILLAIISIDVLILLFQTSTISISAHEADLIYGSLSFIQVLERVSLIILALRLPMIILHILSTILLYVISKDYIEDYKNRIWLVLVFILVPGVVSSALLVDSAGFIIFGLLLFIYIFNRYSIIYSYILLLLFSLLDGGFIYLFLSLIFYSMYTKNRDFLFFNFATFIISFVLYGIKTAGAPEGYFLDTLGLYSAVFTPIVFIYIFYILYRRFLSKNIDLLWFIATTPLLVSLLLSFRQNIYIEDFAPYLIVALPLAAQTFYSSYRIRLKMFRTKYKVIFTLSILFLLLNFFVVFFNRELYLFIENPSKHFARKMHIAKELSIELKNRDIACVDTKRNMELRLRFYGIGNCKENILRETEIKSDDIEYVTISYKYRDIYNASVTKLNIK